MRNHDSDHSRFFAVLTASNIIYDDNGEKVSPEKMTNAVNTGRIKVSEYTPGQTEDDVIADYRKQPTSYLTNHAMLVNLTRNASTSSNSNAFFVSSHRPFKINEKPVDSTPKPKMSGCTVS